MSRNGLPHRGRLLFGIAATVLTAAIAAVHLTAQAPANASRNRRVWTGTIDDRMLIPNATDTTPIRRPVTVFRDVHITFTYVSEDDPNRPGLSRWVSRRLQWDAYGRSASSVQGTECRGSGSLDLGPADDADSLTPQQEAGLEIPCKNWMNGNVWAFIPHPGTKVHLPVFREMVNCEPTRRWTSIGVRYTLSVSPTQTEAIVRFEHATAERAPTAGATYAIRGDSNVLGRWKFVIESSRLRGYATNADISSDFFRIYPVAASLSGRYGTLDPDLVFNPALAEEAGSEWKPPYPDRGSRKWSVIESTDATSVNRVNLEMTAMDFGAHGEVRAYISPACGGGWIPVPVHGGGTVLRFPAKDDDGNFMSDHEQAYRGLDAISDDDGAPSGDGPGDGFTAFEEYRGFMFETGGHCYDPMQLSHTRTSPAKKDLFVHASDPILRSEAVSFQHTSGLEVWPICAAQYVDNDTRTVNFTMHRFPGQFEIGEGLRGAQLTQVRPQHGLHLVNQQIGNGLLGESVAVDPAASGFGPPRYVRRVAIDRQGIKAAYGAARYHQFLTLITHHELGHAVGIRHHGDGNIAGPIVLLNRSGCSPGMVEGTVDGRPACGVSGIALRGQQNSGNAACPMKYVHWKWYVPESSALVHSREVEFKPSIVHNWRGPTRLPGYEGLLLRYEQERDQPPITPAMKFCTTASGTGINSGEHNHAGDSQRRPACAKQLRINDVPGR